MDIKTELLNKLTEIPLHEVIIQVTSTIPSLKFINLKARSIINEQQHDSGEIIKAEYNAEQANLRRALFSFIGELNETDLKKVFIRFIRDKTTPIGKVPVLFIAASPKDLDNLQIAFEYASIKNVLISSHNRDSFSFRDPVLAATINSMVDAINISKPAIVHFSGHAGKKGIVLSDRDNNAELIPTVILDSYFETFNKIDCVFLNACYSIEQAAVISKYTKYVIGMNCPIGDDAAVIFSEAFYRSFFNSDGLDYKKAFKQARAQLQFKVMEESMTPEIWEDCHKMIL